MTLPQNPDAGLQVPPCQVRAALSADRTLPRAAAETARALMAVNAASRAPTTV